MERVFVSKLISRLSEKRRFIQVLTGPRQVGKSTIIRQTIEKLTIPFVSVSADESPDAQPIWIEQQWQTLRLRMDAQQWDEAILIIDEIQRIPDWSQLVKRLWDEDSLHQRSIKVVLLGSARLILQKGLSESLAGRFEEWYIPHWSLPEMQEAFDFTPQQYAWFGGYPGSAELIHDEQRWKNYVRNSLIDTVLSKDIFMMANIQKPALFRNLFELACFYSGSIVSYNKLIGQLNDAGNTTTLSHYQSLLHGAGLVSGLEKFSNTLIKTRSSSPKWQIHNMALKSSMNKDSFENGIQDAQKWGHQIESVVGTYLVSECQTDQHELHYWRDGNDEIDFVVKKGASILGIEVKSGLKSSNSGMGAFKKLYPKATTILVGQSGIPWQEFISLPLSKWMP
jgi:predicted AAA+ superfamily ATPase